jgi:hypothetical protein
VSLPIILTAARPESAAANLFYVIAFIIFIPVALALSFIAKYAIAYIVIKGHGFMEAVKAGWQLFIKNWLVSVEMAFILFFINFFVGLLLVLTILTLTIPLLFLALAAYKLTSLAGLWIVAVLALTMLLAIIILGGAMLATFQISSWTGLFIELTGKGGISKIIRLLSGRTSKK